MTRDSAPVPGFWKSTLTLVTEGLRMVYRGGWRLGGVLLLSQLIILLISLPIIQWLFRTALRSAGMTGLDLGQLNLTGRIPITITIGSILAIIVLSLWLVSLQFTLLLVALEHTEEHRAPSVRGFGRALARVFRKLAKPSSFPLLTYLFLVLPLAGFGFASLLTQGISVPQFVTGELQKSTSGIIMNTAFLLIVGTANARLAATLPVFVLTDASGRQSTKASRLLTRGIDGLRIVVAVLFVAIVTTVVGLIVAGVGILPTILSDRLAPDASPVVAGLSLGAVQVIGAILAGLVTAWISAILIQYVRERKHDLPHRWVELTPEEQVPGKASERTWGIIVQGTAVAVALLLGFANIGQMVDVQREPDTLVLAHRGFTPGGVENTLSSLEAAAVAGVDLVEMDVMQTKDGEFIAMHDVSLGRLTGENVDVKDLTFDEITRMTVRDRAGHEDRIPSFAEYVMLADELDMPLLIEIKLSGAETPDHVDLLVAELEELGLLERNIYHSLDAPSVARLKEIRPDLNVGYTMAFAANEAPDTPADFIVVEQWTASDRVHESAKRAGLGFWVWTVNDEPSYREYLRNGVDGIVSDRPDLILEARSEMTEETGLAGTLLDAFTRWVTIF